MQLKLQNQKLKLENDIRMLYNKKLEQSITIEDFKNQYATLKSKEKQIEYKVEEFKKENKDKISIEKLVSIVKEFKTAENFDLTLMRLKYDIDFDEEVLGSKYDNDLFISKFGTIRFEVNGKEYNNRLELVDMTPYYTKDYSLIQVRDKLKKAEKIYLDFNIRDKVYTYVIKDEPKEEEKEGE